ncbi:MAG: hypothetical protein INR71_05725, partial [Terriglobus roseus]|nr:hypothetical protein [Terriglobus roseus]
FWNQRLPEVLVNCGTPWVVREDTLHSEEQSGANARQRTIRATLERAMTDAQDELAALSLLRDPQHFTPLLAGTHGSAGVYGWIERIRAMMGGHPQRGDHQTGPAAANAGAAARKG